MYAVLSAVFAGLTAILAKVGMKDVESNLATALRTIVVLIFAWVMVFLKGSQNTITQIDVKTLLFLILSGIATGASWMCYFKALQMGDVNKVTPIDKSSTILTMLLAFLFLGEGISPIKGLCMVLIGVGTWLMIEKKKEDKEKQIRSGWMLFALLSAVFASLTSILGKVGIDGVESTFGTAIRTVVVLVMAWLTVLMTGSIKNIGKVGKKSGLFLCLSGITTGASWLCYYKALQDGYASVVVPIDKMSILLTVLFSVLILKEKLSRKAGIGLVLITAGTLLLTLESMLI